MPCAVKSSFKTSFQISFKRSLIQTPISFLIKTGWPNRRSLLSELSLWGLDFRLTFVTVSLTVNFYSAGTEVSCPCRLQSFSSLRAVLPSLVCYIYGSNNKILLCRAVKPALWCTQTCSGPASLRTTLFSLQVNFIHIILGFLLILF